LLRAAYDAIATDSRKHLARRAATIRVRRVAVVALLHAGADGSIAADV
jgi:hypothetical protein